MIIARNCANIANAAHKHHKESIVVRFTKEKPTVAHYGSHVKILVGKFYP